jgi:hypothetical protein
MSDEHLAKISALEEEVAEKMQQLELLHRDSATDSWIKDLPLDPVIVAGTYFSRVLAARRMEMLGSLGTAECAAACGESSRSVQLAIEREDQDIDRLLSEQCSAQLN